MTEIVDAKIPDPVRDGLARGWSVVDAPTLREDVTLETDVAIIGTGAGGGIAAEILADSGLRVLLIEEGALRSSRDFHMRESEAYRDLYQESAARKTADKAINILQGRCVGGSTTVNWTSSFRTPVTTLAHWQAAYGLTEFGESQLAPWFARVEERLGIAPWTVAPNANNAALARGASSLGIGWGAIRRNVRQCWNLGYCGLGCPTNAKQSMLVTTIPHALDRGATLVVRARAMRLVLRGDAVDSLECAAMDASGTAPAQRRIRVRARTYVSAAGAIGSPALLLRSGIGPGAALAELGIEPRHESAGVGGNLQEHPLVPIVFGARGTDTLKSAESPANLLRYLFGRRGPLASNGVEAFAFERIAHPSAPDLELIFAPFEPRNQLQEAPQVHAFGIGCAVVAPRSRGRLWRASPDPVVAPRVDFNMFGDPEGVDRRVLCEGVKLARRIAATAPLAAENAGELRPGDAVRDEAGLLAHAAREAQSVYHPSGTCRMGTDAAAVVDPALGVRGVPGLWVADASVMPTVPRGHPNAVVAMIAFRAAEWIARALRH